MKRWDGTDPGTGLDCSRLLSRMAFSCVFQEPRSRSSSQVHNDHSCAQFCLSLWFAASI